MGQEQGLLSVRDRRWGRSRICPYIPLRAEGLLDVDSRIVSHAGYLYIPLLRSVTRDIVQGLLGHNDFDMGMKHFESIHTRPHSLEDALADVLSPDEIALLPRAFDSVGDIAILEIPDELVHRERMIGEAFLKVHPSFNTVLAKASPITVAIAPRVM